MKIKIETIKTGQKDQFNNSVFWLKDAENRNIKLSIKSETCPYSQGQEIEIEGLEAVNWKDKEGKTQTYYKIKKTPQQFAGKSNCQKEPFEEKIAGFSMSYVKDLIIADKVKIEQMPIMFEKIYQLLLNKKYEKNWGYLPLFKAWKSGIRTRIL